MRPTDEDQPGFKRPNLMSASRRSASDVNILAMLDGLGTRTQARRPLLWCGVAGVLVCALLGTLAWMARDPAPAAMVTETTVAAEPPTLTIPEVVREARPPDSLPLVQPTSLARTTPAAVPVSAGGATIVNAAAAAARERKPPPAPAPTPKHKLERAPKRLAAARVPAARTNVAAHPVPKHPKAAARPAAGPAPVDTDVALISAIMQHASNHHDAAADGDCGNKPCGARTPPRP